MDNDGEWDIAWVEKEAIHDLFDRYHLTPTQKVNHFRNHFEVFLKKFNTDSNEFKDYSQRSLDKKSQEIQKTAGERRETGRSSYI